MFGVFHMTILIDKGMETLHLCASHEPFLFLNLGIFFPCKSVGQLSIRREISTSSFVNSAGSGRHRKYRRQTLLFFLTGYILTGVWMIFLTSDLCYLRSDGVWRPFSRGAILRGIVCGYDRIVAVSGPFFASSPTAGSSRGERSPRCFSGAYSSSFFTETLPNKSFGTDSKDNVRKIAHILREGT